MTPDSAGMKTPRQNGKNRHDQSQMTPDSAGILESLIGSIGFSKKLD
jgi:hypothetical protein